MTAQVRIAYRAPFDWPALVAFLSKRTVAPVEVFEEDEYVRDGIRIRNDPAGSALTVTASWPVAESIVSRARHLFDTEAEPRRIARRLAADRMLGPIIRKHRGIRVPGAWEPFEMVVRAIVGQQVSVAGATTTMKKIVAQFGAFPKPAQLAATPVSGMPEQRAATIRRVAAAVAAGDLPLTRGPSLEESIARLTSIKGIGPWTANYIAMRVLREPDAFPSGDLGLLKETEAKSEKELLRMAEAWRPWRAYAAMLLWSR
ncbi:MAG TPA: AlkA N-terminal domain-containing protein [Thermoanaerobaculia bacterium]|nr:AlkA N-terminal domain-containing protein [Thermoanaerobaculia bacterium]